MTDILQSPTPSNENPSVDSESSNTKGADSENSNTKGADSESSNTKGADSESSNTKGADSKPKFRKWNLLSEEIKEGEETSNYQRTNSVFRARTPHAAAKKAANRGHTSIFLQEVGTKGKGLIHVYEGTKRALEEHEITEHSLKIGAKHKAVVKKLRTIKLESAKDKKKREMAEKRKQKLAAAKAAKDKNPSPKSSKKGSTNEKSKKSPAKKSSAPVKAGTKRKRKEDKVPELEKTPAVAEDAKPKRGRKQKKGEEAPVEIEKIDVARTKKQPKKTAANSKTTQVENQESSGKGRGGAKSKKPAPEAPAAKEPPKKRAKKSQ